MFQPSDERSDLPGRSRPPPARLLGRDRELDTIRRMLWREDVRLLTLTGPPGVGKTRLALEVASRLADAFPDGVTYVDLTPVSDPSLVLAALADCVGLEHGEGDWLVDRLTEHLHDRNTLLVLDSFERVLPAASPLGNLLVGCPGIKLLVTSREPLHLLWEHVLQIQPLTLPDLARLPPPQELSEVPSVALFLQRARTINPDISLTEENARAVAELVVRLDGLPLGIELAASRVRLLSPQMILERLTDRLSLLRWEAQDLPIRQQTLRAAIDWSYDLLSEAEQRLFCQVGVFVGGFELDAAVALATRMPGGTSDPFDVLDGMTSLVDKSLVMAESEREGQVVRYRLLESIQEYALEQLTVQGEEDEARNGHASYFLEFAELAEPELRHAEQGVWFARLEREHENLRAALRWLANQGEWERALRLAASLGYFWWTCGYLAEGRRHLQSALGQAGAASPSLRTRALNALAIILLSEGEHEQAREFLEEALALARSLDDGWSIGQSLTNLGLLAQRRGEWEESAQLLNAARTHWQGIGIPLGETDALVHLGITMLYRGDLESAEHLVTDAVTAYRALGDVRNSAQAGVWAGYLTGERGETVQAAETVTPAVELATRSHDIRLLYHGGVLLYYCTPLITWLASVPGNPDMLARLFGTGEAMCLGTGYVPSNQIQARLAVSLAIVRAHLTPETFAAQIVEGHSLPVLQVGELALQVLESALQRVGNSREVSRDEPAQRILSEREQEVLRLIAEGLSNKAIAERLHIAPSTVSYHVMSVFNKLGVHSRARAVAVAAERGFLRP